MDVLQELGLSGRRTGAFTPSGVIPFKSGVILTPRARVQVPLGAVLPAPFNASSLFLILSLSVHRFNGAALFSLLSRRRKVQLSVRFAPGKVLVSKGQKSSVSLDYDVYDGRWHHFALDIQSHGVFLHTSCGRNSLHAGLSSKKQLLDPEGFFLLGKLNHNSVAFEGAICQFDIYPSAAAAQNYCDHIRRHCREADTYRPVLPAPPPPRPDPNITATLAPTPKILPPNGQIPEWDQTSAPPNPGVTSVPPTAHFTLEKPSKFPTQTVTPSPRISVTLPNPKRNSHSRKKIKPGATKPPKPSGKSLYSPGSPSNYHQTRNQLIGAAALQPEPEGTNMLGFEPTTLVWVTEAATDGFQTFDLDPTQFSPLAGPPGLKGEPGPPVSVRRCWLYDQIMGGGVGGSVIHVSYASLWITVIDQLVLPCGFICL